MPKAFNRPLQRWTGLIAERLVRHRLNRNMTQADLAKAAGISLRTMARLERGGSTTLESFTRVLIALGLGDGLNRLIPDVPVSPIQQLDRPGKKRRRARGSKKTAPKIRPAWSWGDES